MFLADETVEVFPLRYDFFIVLDGRHNYLVEECSENLD